MLVRRRQSQRQPAAGVRFKNLLQALGSGTCCKCQVQEPAAGVRLRNLLHLSGQEPAVDVRFRNLLQVSGSGTCCRCQVQEPATGSGSGTTSFGALDKSLLQSPTNKDVEKLLRTQNAVGNMLVRKLSFAANEAKIELFKSNCYRK